MCHGRSGRSSRVTTAPIRHRARRVSAQLARAPEGQTYSAQVVKFVRHQHAVASWQVALVNIQLGKMGVSENGDVVVAAPPSTKARFIRYECRKLLSC